MEGLGRIRAHSAPTVESNRPADRTNVAPSAHRGRNLDMFLFQFALSRRCGREHPRRSAIVCARKVQARLLYDSTALCYGRRRGEAGE